jgi:hypothetical protein
MRVVIMPRMQDITITNIPIMEIMAAVFTLLLGLVTVTEIMAAIVAVILRMGGIMDMAAIEEDTETAGIKDMAAIEAASIDKNTAIFT